jgi:predicted MFS family arabinose efflux permease
MTRTFWIAALVNFINALSITILIPTIYLYGKQFHLTDFQTSLLFSAYSVAQFFATPIIGKLSDRFGRKPLLVISLVGTVIGNLLAGTATSAGVLFFARFLDGITGGNVSVAQAVVADVTSPTTRARGFGIFGAALGLGFMIGPAISLGAQYFSLGASFLAAAAIAAIALVITIIWLPETLTTKVANQPLFDLGLKTLITGLKLPRIGILLIINFFIGTTFTIFTFAFQPYYIHVLKQDSKSLTLLFLTFGVLGVLMQTRGVSLLTKQFSLIKILFLGLLVRGISFVLMPVVPNMYYFLSVSIIFSLFNSLVQPMISTLISLNSKPQEQGLTSGLNASYLSVSNAIGPVIAGSLINQSQPTTYGYPLYLAGILTLLVLTFATKTRHQYTPTP